MARLFLFDGTALAYRSHFAFANSNLSAADGSPTGATFGFTQALLRILADEKPDGVDAPGEIGVDCRWVMTRTDWTQSRRVDLIERS